MADYFPLPFPLPLSLVFLSARPGGFFAIANTDCVVATVANVPTTSITTYNIICIFELSKLILIYLILYNADLFRITIEDIKSIIVTYLHIIGSIQL
jgi:hypothetical protein